MFADRFPLGSFVFSVRLFTRLFAGRRPLVKRLNQCVLGCDGVPSVRISWELLSECVYNWRFELQRQGQGDRAAVEPTPAASTGPTPVPL